MEVGRELLNYKKKRGCKSLRFRVTAIPNAANKLRDLQTWNFFKFNISGFVISIVIYTIEWKLLHVSPMPQKDKYIKIGSITI